MKKLVLLSVVSFAFILVASTTSNAQCVLCRAAEIYFESTTPLNEGEDKIVEKMNRDWEKQQKEPKQPREPREPREPRQHREPNERP
jgi:hypothetical protein